jgi:hypothetical protein
MSGKTIGSERRRHWPSLAARAERLARELVADADPLRLAVRRTANGATLIDAGIAVSGSLEAGRRIAELCMGGVGWVAFAATRNAPVIDAGLAEAQAQAGEAAAQARRQWLQRMLDGLIVLTALVILYVLMTPHTRWGRKVAASLPQRLYQQLVFALWLLGAERPAAGQTPRAYLETAAATLRTRRSPTAEQLTALTPTLMEYLYTTPERRDTLQPEITQQIRQPQRQTLQELGVRRLILRLLAYGRQKVYGN